MTIVSNILVRIGFDDTCAIVKQLNLMHYDDC